MRILNTKTHKYVNSLNVSVTNVNGQELTLILDPEGPMPDIATLVNHSTGEVREQGMTLDEVTVKRLSTIERRMQQGNPDMMVPRILLKG